MKRLSKTDKFNGILLGTLLSFTVTTAVATAPNPTEPTVAPWDAGNDVANSSGVEPSLIRWLIADLATGDITPDQARTFLATAPAMVQVEGDGPVLPMSVKPPLFGHYLRAIPASAGICQQAWNGPGTGAWYRFDSIAQAPAHQDLTSGSKLIGANTSGWKLYDHGWYLATPT